MVSPEMKALFRLRHAPLILFLSGAIFLSACRPRLRPPSATDRPEPRGFYIQAGVFAREANARAFVDVLRGRGLDAFSFSADSGFQKVWIGAYASRDEAEKAAAALREGGRLDEYFIVSGRSFGAAAVPKADSPNRLRRDLVETARSFIHYPYAWGGASAEEGFDCSGLTMAVYRLNGLDLSRSLTTQYETGRPVAAADLQPGDLVFFATGGDDRISHVGIFVGEGYFVHAPGTNKTVRTDALSNPYYLSRFKGARRYVQDF
jgi:cell wall-associated NlpC family hydrolase